MKISGTNSRKPKVQLHSRRWKLQLVSKKNIKLHLRNEASKCRLILQFENYVVLFLDSMIDGGRLSQAVLHLLSDLNIFNAETKTNLLIGDTIDKVYTVSTVSKKLNTRWLQFILFLFCTTLMHGAISKQQDSRITVSQQNSECWHSRQNNRRYCLHILNSCYRLSAWHPAKSEGNNYWKHKSLHSLCSR